MARKRTANPFPLTTPHEIYYDANGELRCGVGRGIGLKFAETYFRKAQHQLRIASGYFYLSGYKATRDFIGANVQIQILVGRDEKRKSTSQKAERPTQSTRVIDSISREILQELGTTQAPLHDAVLSLLGRINDKTFTIKDARHVAYSHLFHCKFYISDDNYMWSGSVNFTEPAFNKNEEQSTATSDPAEIALFTKYYDDALDKGHDLLQEVRQCLEAWSLMLKPYHAYLKILHCLFGQERPKIGKDGHEPTPYQEEVIVRATQQVEEWGGALLIVATGLGKTVIGSEIAFRLSTQTIPHVVVLAPRIIADKWKIELRSRHLRHTIFDVGLLFRQESEKRYGSVFDLLDSLNRCDENTVLLIDEAHHYRNLLQKDYTIAKNNKRRQENQTNKVKERLLGVVGRGARIVLLTATPYGTNRQNIASLLHLLPHKAPERGLLQEEGAWSIETLQDTATLPVVTLLGMVDLLRLAAKQKDMEANGRLFIDFGKGKKKYFPKSILLTSVKYTPCFEAELQEAFKQEVFDAKPTPYDTFDETYGKNVSKATDTSRKNAAFAWLSSAQELLRFLTACYECGDAKKPGLKTEQERLLFDDAFADPGAQGKDDFSGGNNTKRGVNYNLPQEQRQTVLQPIIDKVRQISPGEEQKIQQLRDLLVAEHGKTHKVLVFVERHATAYHLSEALKGLTPQVRTGCTVRQGADKSYALLEFNQRLSVIQRFSPRANNIQNLPSHEGLDVLICTDADGIGVDMEDACVMVNYDLPYGADEVFQRAGRILRMTTDPDRIIHLYTFVPEFSDKNGKATKIVDNLLSKLKRRHDESTALLGGKVISGAQEEIPLACEADLEVFSQAVHSPLESKEPGASSLLGHIAFLQRHLTQAREVPEVSLSAKMYDKDEPRVVVLVFFEGRYFLIVYNVNTQKLEDVSRDDALEMIRSQDENEDRAFVNPKRIEQVEQEALNAMVTWLAQRKNASDDEEQAECLRVCSIYLQPRTKQAEAVQQMLRDR